MDPADMEDVEDVEEEETGEDVNSKGQENKTLLLQTWTVLVTRPGQMLSLETWSSNCDWSPQLVS